MENIVKTLHSAKYLKTEKDIEVFISTISRLKDIPRDKTYLPSLLGIFSDNASHIDVMQSLIHIVEAYDMEDYVSILVNETPCMINEARDWLSHLYFRLLNADLYRDQLRFTLSASSEDTSKIVIEFLQSLIDEGENDEEKSRIRTKVDKVID